MENKNFDFIIIGAGPAGIFAALEMAQKRPQSRVLIVDTGRAISHRACPARIDGQCKHCDPCAIVHGWAGAGAFSDGKLSLSDEVGGHVSDYIGQQARDGLHSPRRRHLPQLRSQQNRSRPQQQPRGRDRLRGQPLQHPAWFPARCATWARRTPAPCWARCTTISSPKRNTTFLELTSAEDILCEEGKVTGV